MTTNHLEPFAPCVIPAYLGWGNVERDKVQLRLYATDQEPATAPRWDRRFVGGRVAEYACVENGGVEGDRYLVVRLGNRFVPDDKVTDITRRVEALIEEMMSRD